MAGVYSCLLTVGGWRNLLRMWPCGPSLRVSFSCSGSFRCCSSLGIAVTITGKTKLPNETQPCLKCLSKTQTHPLISRRNPEITCLNFLKVVPFFCVSLQEASPPYFRSLAHNQRKLLPSCVQSLARASTKAPAMIPVMAVKLPLSTREIALPTSGDHSWFWSMT